MDQKTWLWGKKSSEKTIFATNKVVNPLRRTEEPHLNPTEKGIGSDRSVKSLNEKLASVLLDCHVKEDFETKGGKGAEEIVTGKEKVEEEKVFPKKELGEALHNGVAENERFIHSDDALKECKKQLSIVQEEQEQKVHNAVMMTSREYEKVQKKLEEKFVEASKQLASLSRENSNLTKALLVKEKMIEDLNRCKTQSDAEFCALMTRQDSTEKENAFLKYEFHMLEKELQIRNEEMEYYRQSLDASQKQQLESLKKIAMLEQECQRLRAPMRKRLPGASGNTRSEVQAKGQNQTEMTRRRKLNPTRDLIVRDATVENSPEILSKDMNFMFDRLRIVEEENEALKKLLNRKSPLGASRDPGSDMQLLELYRGQKSMELTRGSHIANKHSTSSDFDISSDDAISSSGSWANALISELEHFKNGKLKNLSNPKGFEVSDISLMDDFVEMEKLAIVSADTPSGNRYKKDLVSVAEDKGKEKPFDWLQVVLRAMLEQKNVSKRSLEELLGDIKIALGFVSSPTAHQADKTAKSWTHTKSDPLPISGYLPWNSANGSQVLNASPDVSCDQHIHRGLSESIGKIIKLIQEINLASLAADHTPNATSEKDQKLKPSATSADYYIRVFQWTRMGLNAILQRFLQTCDDLLNGKSNLEKFAEEVASTLDWILNNYVTLNNAASTRDKIKKHFGWNEPRENDQQVCLPTEESDIVQPKEQSLGWPLLNSKEDQNALTQLNKVQCTLQEENSKLKNELKNVISAKSDMEAKLNLATEKSKACMIQLEESQKRVGILQAELEALKETKGTIEDQIENEKLINDDLDTQLTVAKAKLNEVFQKVSSLEVELEDKRNCCEELEATCLELQLQLESDPTKGTPKCKINQEERRSQSSWEITTASAKLAECQETIANLGKQLKALATSREAALLDKAFSDTSLTSTATKDEKLNKRSSLRDRMLAEDDAKAENLNSQKVNDATSNADAQKSSFPQSDGQNATGSPNVAVRTPVACWTSSYKPSNNATVALAIVPSKKKGGGFDLLRRLILRRKKRNSQKPQFSAKV